MTIRDEHSAPRTAPLSSRDADGGRAPGDLRVVIRAHFASRCAGCGRGYLPGTEIGHSIASDGWVAACCSPELAGRAR